jgi:hypothetical protein
VITSETEEFGLATITEIVSSMTTSYTTSASTYITTGAVIITTTSLAYTESATFRNGPNATATLVPGSYLGEPYTVSCTYVK